MIGVLPIGRPEPDAEPMAAFFWSLKPAEADTVRATGLDGVEGTRRAACGRNARRISTRSTASTSCRSPATATTRCSSPIGRRLAVIGDAAHSTSPQLGQGANMALLDAAALAHALDRAGKRGGRARSLCRARRWHVRLFQALSWAFTPFYQSDSTVLPFVRDRLVATVAKMPPAPQFLAAMVAGTMVDPFRRIGLKEVDWNEKRLAMADATDA